MDETRIYEIDVTKKYILEFGVILSPEISERIRQQIGDWLKGDAPFLLIDSRVKLVRVSEIEVDENGRL